MKKFNAILDDTTIINFFFFFKLLKRYYIISLLVPVLIFGYAAYFYKSQNIVYIKNINFTFKKDNSSSPTAAIASLVGENNTELTISDIIAITKSPDFKEHLGESIARDSKGYEITLSALTSKSIKKVKDEFSFCNDNIKCYENEIEKRVSGFFSLKEHPQIDKMMKLEVKSLTPTTSDVLLRNIEESLIQFRVNQIKHSIIEQKKISNRLINQKTQELKDLKYFEAVKHAVQGKAKLHSIMTSVANLEGLSQKQTMSAEITQTQYEQTKKVGSKNIESEKDTLEHLQQLKKEITNLKQDIRALEQSQTSFNKEDKYIITKLKSDLKLKQVKYKKLKSSTTLTINDSRFIANKNQQSNSLEFQYKISRQQIKKTQQELNRLKDQREKIIRENEENAQIIEKGKTTEEYIKLLSTKLMQLQIIESTIISDIIFDKKSSGIRAFRRTTKSKVMLFSGVLSIFFLFSIILIRYITDPRIYDEYELQKTFEDLNVIGKTPDFNP